MTLTQSDVTELLDAIRAGGDIDVIGKGVHLRLRALNDAEATRRSLPLPAQRHPHRPSGTASETACSRPKPST